jgi:hypothetical protein
MRPLFLVGHVLSWRKKYVQNYVFAFCACGWGLVLSMKLLAGKVCFHVFMFFENEPVDTLLILILLVINTFFSSFNDVDLLHIMLVDCCMLCCRECGPIAAV